MDLSGLSMVELRVLDVQLKGEIKRREQEDMIKAREQIMAIANSVGIPLKDLLGITAAPMRIKSGAVAVRYRHPMNPSLQWTGRGRQPKWVAAWEAEHKSLDGLRV
jgi:DNA-binding protein H-NS